MPVLHLRDVSKAFGTKVLADGVTFTVRRGDRVGLLGMNGAGKSTLLKIAAGLESPDVGTLDRRRGARILYLAQEPILDEAKSARGIVTGGLAEWHVKSARHAEVTEALGKGEGDHEALVVEQAELAERIEELGGWDRDHEVDDVLHRLGIRDPEKIVGTMSGGERRRVALAEILVAKPDLAILDEPTNHLDADTITWLEDYWRTQSGSLLLVTHDRAFLDAVATRILELDAGKVLEFTGNYADYLEKKAELDAHAERVEAKRQNFLRRETEWLRRGAKARTTKQKARIDRAESAMAVAAPKERGRVELEVDTARIGKTIVEFRAVTGGHDGKELFEPITMHLRAGDRTGVVGPNGVGKTTFLSVMLGELEPMRGEVIRGTATRFAYFDQARATLRDDWTVFDNVAEREGALQTGGGAVELGGERIELRSYLERFLFDGTAQRQKVSSLSGGERARVALALVLKTGANVLVLDEPTNDLDIFTLASLEEMLEGWGGCVVLVSHDRRFLNRVATHILAFEASPSGPAKVTLYAGGYDDYRARKAEEDAEAEAVRAAARESAAPRSAVPSAEKSGDRAGDKAADKKLTYAERKDFETLMDRMTVAEEKVAALEAKLAEPTMYTTRADEAKRVEAELSAARADVEALLERWEFLEAKRSAAGG
ncbi:MAG: ABC-F family ATP-binding cassette domain-containing protein [Polyangiaceae bacterium]